MKKIPFSFAINLLNIEKSDFCWAVINGFLNSSAIYEFIKKKTVIDDLEDRILKNEKHDSENGETLFDEYCLSCASESISLKEKWMFVYVCYLYQEFEFEEFYKNVFEFYFDNNEPIELRDIVNITSNILDPQKKISSTVNNVKKYINYNKGRYGRA